MLSDAISGIFGFWLSRVVCLKKYFTVEILIVWKGITFLIITQRALFYVIFEHMLFQVWLTEQKSHFNFCHLSSILTVLKQKKKKITKSFRALLRAKVYTHRKAEQRCTHIGKAETQCKTNVPQMKLHFNCIALN